MAAIVAVALTSCNRVSKEQYEQATHSSDSLLTVALQQGNEIYELSTTLHSVSQQLDQINGQLEISNGEDQTLVEQRDRLMQKLATVQQTIQQKQQALDELQKKYSTELSQNKVLKQTIDRLQTEVSGYQKEISGYKLQVAQKEQQITDLTDTLTQTQEVLTQTQAENAEQKEVINTQDQMLNTGYYLVADKDRLNALGLLEKDGVFSKKRLTRQGFTAEGFTKVDIRELSELDLGAKKAEILSSHPAESYSIQTLASGHQKLFIKDQVKFWSNSRYLVVKVK